MSLHQQITERIKEAMRAKDTVLLNTLRGLNALFLNELLSRKPEEATSNILPDEKVLAIIKRSVKQRKDSIQQFEIGHRKDLADEERAELKILESYLPVTMTHDEIVSAVNMKIESLKAEGLFDPGASGKITGMIIKELAGKADGAEVKAVIEEILMHQRSQV